MARVADPLLFDRRGVGEQRCIDIEEGRKKERERKEERKKENGFLDVYPRVSLDQK